MCSHIAFRIPCNCSVVQQTGCHLVLRKKAPMPFQPARMGCVLKVATDVRLLARLPSTGNAGTLTRDAPKSDVAHDGRDQRSGSYQSLRSQSVSRLMAWRSRILSSAKAGMRSLRLPKKRVWAGFEMKARSHSREP